MPATIARDTILTRARAVPLGSVSYSQAAYNTSGPAKGYRRDCSGFVSYCWGLPTSGAGTWGGYSTATFVTHGIIVPIPRAELQPGDAIGYCGATTAGKGGGHIALWLGKSGKLEHILDHGSGMGPKDRNVTWGIGTGWQAAAKLGAWRFVGVTGAAPIPLIQEGDMAVIARHGDGGETVKALQLAMLAANGEKTWVKGQGILPKHGPDSGYGDEVAAGLRKLIGAGDGKTYDAGDRALLLVLAAQRTETVLEPLLEPDEQEIRGWARDEATKAIAAAEPVLVPHTHDEGATGPAVRQ